VRPYDGTVEAQKFLSCVYRLREKSGIDFGVYQVAEVLTGAQSEKGFEVGPPSGFDLRHRQRAQSGANGF
jgi:superfamily II DNA helicase RecQ